MYRGALVLRMYCTKSQVLAATDYLFFCSMYLVTCSNHSTVQATNIHFTLLSCSFTTVYPVSLCSLFIFTGSLASIPPAKGPILCTSYPYLFLAFECFLIPPSSDSYNYSIPTPTQHNTLAQVCQRDCHLLHKLACTSLLQLGFTRRSSNPKLAAN